MVVESGITVIESPYPTIFPNPSVHVVEPAATDTKGIGLMALET